MVRIRLHGRGGQGIKTAGRILGSAFFHEGFEVQDAPRYGAERRGAPLFATVRAARRPIHERGVIAVPDLVVVADGTLLHQAAPAVLAGVDGHTVLVVQGLDGAGGRAAQGALADLPQRPRAVLGLPPMVEALGAARRPLLSTAGAGAAARLVGVISRGALAGAVREELEALPEAVVARNVEAALAAYDAAGDHVGVVTGRAPPPVESRERPAWIELAAEPAALASPTVYAPANSAQTRTGLWRTQRPVIDPEQCRHCWWVCVTFCPENAVAVGAGGTPEIDYEHCKGCLICLTQCPSHAIAALAEHEAAPGARS